VRLGRYQIASTDWPERVALPSHFKAHTLDMASDEPDPRQLADEVATAHENLRAALDAEAKSKGTRMSRAKVQGIRDQTDERSQEYLKVMCKFVRAFQNVEETQ
jgi:hypothetical protein